VPGRAPLPLLLLLLLPDLPWKQRQRCALQHTRFLRVRRCWRCPVRQQLQQCWCAVLRLVLWLDLGGC
jgi:hypothetical protein